MTRGSWTIAMTDKDRHNAHVSMAELEKVGHLLNLADRAIDARNAWEAHEHIEKALQVLGVD